MFVILNCLSQTLVVKTFLIQHHFRDKQLSQQRTPNSLGRAVGAAWRRTLPMGRRTAPICWRTAPMRSADVDGSADGTDGSVGRLGRFWTKNAKTGIRLSSGPQKRIKMPKAQDLRQDTSTMVRRLDGDAPDPPVDTFRNPFFTSTRTPIAKGY